MDRISVEESLEYEEYEAYLDARHEEGESWVDFPTFQAMCQKPQPAPPDGPEVPEDDIPF